MPYVLPYQPTLRDDVKDVLKQALLAYLTKGVSLLGQVPTSPTPGNMGSLSFPSGASTRVSPSELSQIQGLGGVPTRQGTLLPSSQVSYQPPTRLGIQPDLSRQLQQAQIDQAKAQTALAQQRASQPPIDLQSLLGQGGKSLFGNQASIYQLGDVIERDGEEYEVVGFDTDGTPLVELR